MGRSLSKNMQVKLKNDSLVAILEKRQEIFDEIQKLNKKLETTAQKRTNLATEMDKLKEATAEIIKNENIELGEFEIITAVTLIEGEAVLTIIDKVEEFKELVRESKAKQENKEEEVTELPVEENDSNS